MNKELREILRQRPDLKDAIQALTREQLAMEREEREKPKRRAKTKAQRKARRNNRPRKKRSR